MNTVYYKLENGNIKNIEEKIDAKNWEDNLDWVDIYYDDINEVIDLLSFLPLINDSKALFTHPENHPLPTTNENYIIQSFKASKNKNIYDHEYFTLIILKKIIIMIIPQNNKISINIPEPKDTKSLFNDLRFYYIYKLMTEVIAININSINIARKRQRIIEKKLVESPDELNSILVMNNQIEIGQLADIVEDQNVSFRVLTSLFENQKNSDDIKRLQKLQYGFSELNRMLERLEEKAESFRLQFVMIQQEVSTHKINVLTIIQAIFVPLTFIAGVYGMNFKYIPELEWEYGYFITWGSFLIIVASLLIYFKKKGWFD